MFIVISRLHLTSFAQTLHFGEVNPEEAKRKRSQNTLPSSQCHAQLSGVLSQ
jgi:hypothetical protein